MRKRNPGQKRGEKTNQRGGIHRSGSVARQNDKQRQQKPVAERCNDRYHE